MNKQTVELKDTSAEEKFASLQGLTRRALAMTEAEIEQAKKKGQTVKGKQKRLKDATN